MDGVQGSKEEKESRDIENSLNMGGKRDDNKIRWVLENSTIFIIYDGVNTGLNLKLVIQYFEQNCLGQLSKNSYKLHSGEER